MKKNIILGLLLAGVTQIAFGQVTDGEAKIRSQNVDSIQGWNKGGVIAISLAQTALINWAAGGQNSFATNGLVSVFANYRKGKSYWNNSLDIGYGLLKQGKGSDFMKTDDKFDFLSKYGQKASGNLYYAALINFKTQMTVGKDYAKDTAKISNLLAPAYFIGALGVDYKPNNYFSAFAAPLTGKITIVNDQELANAGAYGVTAATIDDMGRIIPGQRSKSEFGGYVRFIYSRSDFDSEVLRNVAFTSKLDLFSNYLRNPQNIDVSWETQIALKVNQYISLNINAHLLYDDNIKSTEMINGVVVETGPKVQFKNILGVGFFYKI